MSSLSTYAAMALTAKHSGKLCLVCGLSKAIPVGWIDPASGQRCDDETMCHCPSNLLENINMKTAKPHSLKSHEAKPKKTKAQYTDGAVWDGTRGGFKPDWAEVMKGCVLDLCEGLEKAAIALGDRQKQGLAYAAETIATSVQLAIASMRQAQRDDIDALTNRIRLMGERVVGPDGKDAP